MAFLEVDDIQTYYGNIQALKGVSLTVEKGEIVTLIGSNGAGKTTTLRTIAGVLRPRKGTVRLGDRDLTKVPANEIVRLGLAHSPEGRRIFSRMSVKENLEMGAYARNDPPSEFAKDFERVYELFPRLKERLTQRAGTLSGGEQQMLAIGRALMARPTVLLLDEPSMGLAPVVVDEIVEALRELRRGGMSILLVEQNAKVTFSITEQCVVLENGRRVKYGPSSQLRQDPEVRRIYLGL